MPPKVGSYPGHKASDWQSDKDMAHRREMIQNMYVCVYLCVFVFVSIFLSFVWKLMFSCLFWISISISFHRVALLKQRDKNANQEWINKLPQMVKQLEVSLYRSAVSFEAYADKKTLKQRLQLLAMDIAKKTEGKDPGPGNGGPPPPPPPPNREPRDPQPPPLQRQENQREATEEWKVRIKHKQQRLLLLHHSSKCKVVGPCPVTQHCQDMKKLWDHMRNCQNSHCKVPHCFSSRSILSHYRKCKDPQCPACGPVRATVRGSNPIPPPSSSLPPQQPRPHPPQNRGQPRMPYEDPSYPPICPPANNPIPAPPEQRETTDPRIKHKQQRLLLLRHASKCTAPEGKCTKTPYCASMKKLWKHISECQDHNCSVPHCLSSRCVLMHYRKCKDPKCPTCAPVRSVISKPLSPPSQESPPPSRDFKRQRTNDKSPINPPDRVPSIQRPPEVQPPVPTPKPNDDSVNSLISCFTTMQIRNHIDSLNRTFILPTKDLKEKCISILEGLQKHTHGWVFNAPVDPVELDLPDYYNVIKKPMDLGTISKKVESGAYHTIEEFSFDVRLTFNNAMQYNENGSVVYNMANEMMDRFTGDYEKLRNQLKEEDDLRRKNSKACGLCGIEKLLFEPTIYFCVGMNCQSKRIHRNRNYYIGGNNQYHWCNQCYNELDSDKAIEFPDSSFKKGDLVKKKNDEVTEENWVQCDTCDKWFHQICGLFNSRLNKDKKYSCPNCLLKDRESGKTTKKPMIPCAKDLPRTKLSEWLENSVMNKVKAKILSLANERKESDVSFDEHKSLSIWYCTHNSIFPAENSF